MHALYFQRAVERLCKRVVADSRSLYRLPYANDQTGTPMRVTLTIFPADRNQFIINVDKGPALRYSPPAH